MELKLFKNKIDELTNELALHNFEEEDGSSIEIGLTEYSQDDCLMVFKLCRNLISESLSKIANSDSTPMKASHAKEIIYENLVEIELLIDLMREKQKVKALEAEIQVLQLELDNDQ